SAEFRKTALYWSSEADATRAPDNCSSCNYFRRSQPWAHLLCGAEARRVFPESVFWLGLNRVTTKQLLGLLQENDLIITKGHRAWVNNVPPPNLELEYGRQELTTFQLTLRGYRAWRGSRSIDTPLHRSLRIDQGDHSKDKPANEQVTADAAPELQAF